MFSKVLISIAIFLAATAIILSDFQMVNAMLPKLPDDVMEQLQQIQVPNPPNPQVVALDPQGRLFFGNLFNLSAALADAPTNVSALGFVPLGTLLFGANNNG